VLLLTWRSKVAESLDCSETSMAQNGRCRRRIARSRTSPTTGQEKKQNRRKGRINVIGIPPRNFRTYHKFASSIGSIAAATMAGKFVKMCVDAEELHRIFSLTVDGRNATYLHCPSAMSTCQELASKLQKGDHRMIDLTWNGYRISRNTSSEQAGLIQRIK
jgi:hypothetical protein